MGRWTQFAGLASKYQKKPLHILFANPFEVFESVYPQQLKALDKVGLDVSRRAGNFTLHRKTTHPAVDKSGPNMAPGWNSSTVESTAVGRNACYVIFDKRGDLVFQGRMTFAELEALVGRLIAE